jgi:hypothetical protein
MWRLEAAGSSFPFAVRPEVLYAFGEGEAVELEGAGASMTYMAPLPPDMWLTFNTSPPADPINELVKNGCGASH